MMNQEVEFDFGLLEKPLFQFIAVADSHDKLPTDTVDREFPSRMHQHDRVTTLLELMKKVPADFAIHMGDLVQEYPEKSGFPAAFAEAVVAMRSLPVPVYHVAGNHDVGDKPDRTMPTHPVSPESLANYHQVCGRSWYRVDQADCRLLVINSQILDTDLPEEREQREWLETEMASAEGKRLMLFLHLPLYLGKEDEPALGNYDVLGVSSRRWLLDLIKRHEVRFVAGAHVHFAFFDTIGECEYHQLASPCFTRPGFAHLFSSSAPSERGRNDQEKLGFYLVRVFPDEIRLHFIRTSGATDVKDIVPEGSRILLVPSTGGRRGSPLGATLREPILREVEVPIAFPSVVRQRVRNDYPFYNLRDMGAGHLRFPWHDWEDAVQRNRLAQLAAGGVSLTSFSLEESGERFPTTSADVPSPEVFEWQLPGVAVPPGKEFQRWIKTCQERGLQTSLASVIPGSQQAGKQHPRTRIGYSPEGLAEINAWLKEERAVVDRVVIDLGSEGSCWDQWFDQALARSSQDPAWDLKLEFGSTDDAQNCATLAEAFVLALAVPQSRLFVDPLTDHDRTMDAVNGLCDGRHNPRPAFSVYRTLNGVFFPEREEVDPDRAFTVTRINGGLYSITTPEQSFGLVIREEGLATIPSSWRITTSWDLCRCHSRIWKEEQQGEVPLLFSYIKE